MTCRHIKGDKMPRQYAHEILQLKTREERRTALMNVPENIRDWVKFYVEDCFEKRRQ